MNAQDVADYLQQHPEFFDEHAALFATLTVPHPHGGRAIPLAERQMITLRDKNRALELKVAELMRYGQENDAIAERLARWTRMLLLQRAPRLLPETLTGSLEEIFSVPHVALTLWEASDEYAEPARTRRRARRTDRVRREPAPALLRPADRPRGVGPAAVPSAGERAVALALVTADGVAADGVTGATDDAVDDTPSEIRSVALIPLRRGAAPAAFGLLALGSGDARRFHDGMGTDFLARIGENSSAALTRLLR